MSNQDSTPILTRDPNTGDYVADFRIAVPAEFYQRAFFKLLEEENVDLTSPEALARVIERVGIVTRWMTHPYAKVTSIPTAIQAEVPAQQPEHPAAKLTQPTLAMRLEARLREAARHVPPHTWDDTLLTPSPGNANMPKKEKADIGRLRYDERKLLKKLREEWEQGTFTLDAEAAHLEEVYQKAQRANLTTKLETVAQAVNGARLH